MRGVDLNLFDFDYDLTWAALFLNADGKVYGRYGGRDAASPDTFLSLEGLRYALTAALEAHQGEPTSSPFRAPLTPKKAEDYPAAARLTEKACIHCHQVYDFRREARQEAGLWKQDEVWVHPLPENLGLMVDPKQGNRLVEVKAASLAAQAGLRAGDALDRVNEVRIASIADVQYALHHAPATGSLSLTWHRDSSPLQARLNLPAGWRHTDLSWRPSLKGVGPAPSVHGEDLSPDEKRALGLTEKQLAFRQENFVTRPARQAGLRQNDIILGIDGKRLEMTARQFQVHIRLNYQVGDAITWNIVRNGQRLDLPMTLPARSPF